MYLYRAIDKNGTTVDFLFSQTRNLKHAKRIFCKAYARHGLPVQGTIDGSQTNLEATRRCHAEVRMRTRTNAEPLEVRQSRYMNNRIEQVHRRIKRRIRPMLGFKSELTAAVIIGGIELIHMIRKGQMTGTTPEIRPLPSSSTPSRHSSPLQRSSTASSQRLRQNQSAAAMQ